MIDAGEVSKSVFSALKGFGYNIKMYTEEGAETLNPEDAKSFFSMDPNLMVDVDEETTRVNLHKNEEIELSVIEPLLDRLKNIAHTNFYDFDIKNYGKEIAPKNYAYQAKVKKEENLMNNMVSESVISRLTGSRKTSSQAIGEVRIVIKHNAEVDETKRGARTRNIQNIFIETAEGRIKLPHKSLMGARAIARHIANGGVMEDAIGQHILESTEQFIKLKEFIRYAKANKLVNETSADVIATVRDSMKHISEKLKRFSGKKTYFSEKDKCESVTQETLSEIDDNLKDMFTVKIFSDKLNTVLPIVSNIVNSRNSFLEKVEEASMGTVYISEKPFMNGIVFENATDELSYKVKSLSHQIIGNKELQEFMLEVAQKINKCTELNSFETSVLENVLSNVKIFDSSELVQDSQPIKESKAFSQKIKLLYKK